MCFRVQASPQGDGESVAEMSPLTASLSDFQDFFNERDAEKNSLYRNVVFYGSISLFISVLPLFVGFVFFASSSQSLLILGQVLTAVGASGFSLSICIASTVPAEEFDIEEELNRRTITGRALKIFLALLGLMIGGVGCCFPPYFPSIPLVLVALWVLFHVFPKRSGLEHDASPPPPALTPAAMAAAQLPFLYKVSIGVLLVCVTVIQAISAIAIFPAAMATNVTGFFADSARLALADATGINTAFQGASAAVFALGLCYTAWYIFGTLLRLRYSCQGGLQFNPLLKRGWPTTMLYSTLYLCLFGLGVQFINNGLINVILNLPLSTSVTFYVLAVLCHSPLLFLYLYGKEKTFTLLARYFEFDLKRLQNDGAMMAYLVSKSSTRLFASLRDRLEKPSALSAPPPVWWVKRNVMDKALKPKNPDPNHIQRWFWAKGTIISIENAPSIEELNTPRSTASTSPRLNSLSGTFSLSGSGSGRSRSSRGSMRGKAPRLPVTLTVRVDMKEDVDRSWVASYRTVQEETVLDIGLDSSPRNWESDDVCGHFDSWVERNFASGEDVDKSSEWAPRHNETHTHWRRRVFGDSRGGDDVPEWLPPLPSEQFEAWRAHFAGHGQQAKKDATFASSAMKITPHESDKCVTLVITIPVREDDEEAMKKWATDSDNFRSFDWENRKKDLFSRSPRQLSSKIDRDMHFALSHPRSIITNADKLDYFVSHSWEYDGEDSGENKYRKVREFMEKQRAGLKRYPSLWLDKVCIDQSDTSQGISVLPIIIGGCKQVLILLSPKYLRRLWCVWELFTLFTFCNKELALERVVILPLVDFPKLVASAGMAAGGATEASATAPSIEGWDAARAGTVAAPASTAEDAIGYSDFDIDNAHCFDPNEELKLRQVMSEIGFERLRKANVFEQLQGKFNKAIAHMRKEKEELAAREEKEN